MPDSLKQLHRAHVMRRGLLTMAGACLSGYLSYKLSRIQRIDTLKSVILSRKACLQGSLRRCSELTYLVLPR